MGDDDPDEADGAAGCAVGASRHATLESALAAVVPFAGPPQATVLGRAERLDILHAAMMNGNAPRSGV
jgi:2-methylcitrate dehydratase PrpD